MNENKQRNVLHTLLFLGLHQLLRSKCSQQLYKIVLTLDNKIQTGNIPFMTDRLSGSCGLDWGSRAEHIWDQELPAAASRFSRVECPICPASTLFRYVLGVPCYRFEVQNNAWDWRTWPRTWEWRNTCRPAALKSPQVICGLMRSNWRVISGRRSQKHAHLFELKQIPFFICSSIPLTNRYSRMWMRSSPLNMLV